MISVAQTSTMALSRVLKEWRFETNVLGLVLVGLVTLFFTYNSHKQIHHKVTEHHERLESHCRGQDDASCGLEVQKLEYGRDSFLFDNEYMRGISKERSLECSGHGFQDVDGDCQCCVLYKGTNCSKSYKFLVRLPGAWRLRADRVASTRAFNGTYNKDFIMNQQGFPNALEKKHVYERIAKERYTLNRDGSVMRRREVIGAVDKPRHCALCMQNCSSSLSMY